MTMRAPRGSFAVVVTLIALSVTSCQRAHDTATTTDGGSHPVATATLTRVGSVDDRYQSFNVEMLEVTGGKFWKPYGPELDAILSEGKPAAASAGSDTPAGMDPRLYEYLPPIDLANARLRKLASALGPAYVRVSGTWANTTYFPDSDTAPSTPPTGFAGVLTHAQWKGVVDFSRSVDARIVTPFATGAGVRERGSIDRPVVFLISRRPRVAALPRLNS
jgi:heparanase